MKKRNDGNGLPSFAAEFERRLQRRHKIAFARQSIAFVSCPIQAETATKA
jgi:hypothetical protein